MLPREFAIDVVRTLRSAGYEALWAGGCVRDEVLGRVPKDYDVATNARPDEVRQLFGYRRTLPVGAAFGVIMVVGTKSAGNVEVATFRRDDSYTDGRRPDSVTFSTAQVDAARRDFTINGLFYDPLEQQVIDYVGGLDDLRQGIVRAIGDPHARITEDKLRMLRAVRFAATFQFQLDPACLEAVREHADEIQLVSAERISSELRQMLIHRHRAAAMRLLVQSQLLPVLLPSGSRAYGWDLATGLGNGQWQLTLEILENLGPLEQAAPALAALLRGPVAAEPPLDVMELGKSWRLTNEEISTVQHLLQHEALILSARQAYWPDVQRALIMPHAAELLQYCQAVATAAAGGQEDVAFCHKQIAQPEQLFNPPPLISGNDLKTLGIPPGKQYTNLLKAIRDQQLLKLIHTREEAIRLAQKLHADAK
jgi:poly(A) polymerase